MEKLLRSKDRKVANAVTTPKSGKNQAKIANTFGLPAGREYSCPSATSVCEKVCYAGKLERIYKGVREVLVHNWNILKDADYWTMYDLLNSMIMEFRKDCERTGSEKFFRIHWDGDFFNDTYTEAWRDVILYNDDIQFWVYTRVKSAFQMLDGIQNLSLYFSTDSENQDTALELRQSAETGRLAMLADTFAEGEEIVRGATGKVGAKCPENAKRVPLISDKGSACMVCKLCPSGKADIRFAVSKK